MAHATTSKKSARVSGRGKAATATEERNARTARAKPDRSRSGAKRHSRSLAKLSAASVRKTKSAYALDLLRRAQGATLTELMAATGWQAHSVRGFLSGTVRKRLQLPLRSAAGDGGRRYTIDVGASTHDAS